MYWYNYGFFEEKPNDAAITLTDEEYDTIMTQVGNGGELLQDENGRPYVKRNNEQEKENEKFLLQRQIDAIIEQLSNTDYIANKIVEAETEEEREQIRQEYAETIAQRRVWRNRASELKDLLKEN